MSKTTRTLYNVISYGWTDYGGESKNGGWGVMGYSPGGTSIDDAVKYVRDRLQKTKPEHLNYVKFVITKTVEVTEEVKEILGKESSFFLLKD